MSRSPLAVVGVAALAVLLVASAARVQAARERLYPASADAAIADDSWLYLQSGTVVRRLTGSLSALAADLYWIRAIQHYGGTKRRLAEAVPVAEPPAMLVVGTSDEYRLLYPLLDITTTLDPRFKIAYRFGAVFLAEPYPNGPGRPDLAQALLEKGLRAQPDKWEYMQDIGFVHYWYDHDYRAAARWFEKAAAAPGAPWWLRSLAATTLAQGGDRRSSRLMWESIRQSAEIDWLRRDAERRLVQLQVLDVIDLVQQRVDEYTRRFGAPPADWNALVRAQHLAAIPTDPYRVPFELVGSRVQLSHRSRLWPLPEEPRATERPRS
jgi:hypothetical protein